MKNKNLFRTICSCMIAMLVCNASFAQLKPTPEQVAADRARNIRLPQNDAAYKSSKSYIEDEPDNDYLHAPEASYEAFRDIKYSIRIHWGVYSILEKEASWPLLRANSEGRMQYNELYKQFNPKDFDADHWMDWFKRCGMQAFAFTAKHCDGFSMWRTKTKVQYRANYLNPLAKIIEPCNLHYSIEETPFKRDIVGELCDAAHRKGIKIDLYYSHIDWYDADFRPYGSHPLTTERYLRNENKDFGNMWHNRTGEAFTVTPNPDTAAEKRLIERHREQLRELVTNYGKIDMICFDGEFGKKLWPELKETVKLLRQWSPETMFRARGIGNYGDYYQPETFVPGNKENTGMPWMSICLLARQYSYDPAAKNYKDAKWVIHNLIDAVAKGGCFMVIVSPDAKGNFHPRAVEELEKVGDWLKINGKGIYDTRDCEVWKSGDFHFTRSKDNKHVYAFTTKRDSLSQREAISNPVTLHIPAVTPRKGGKVYMLGYKKSLKWTADGDGINITIPAKLAANLPCEYAWGFEIEIGSDYG